MKRVLPLLLLLSACTNAPQQKGQTAVEAVPPRPGTLIAADSVRIEDPLNELYFAVEVRATKTKGVYDVDGHHGYAEGASQFTMPRGGESLVPVMRRQPGPSFVIGFRTEDDTSFHEYYEVSGVKNQLKMQYLHAYSFK